MRHTTLQNARGMSRHLTFNQWVAGSSPARLINKMNELREAASLPFLFVYAFMYAFILQLSKNTAFLYANVSSQLI